MTVLELKEALRRARPGTYICVDVSYDDCFDGGCQVSLAAYPPRVWEAEVAYWATCATVEEACLLLADAIAAKPDRTGQYRIDKYGMLSTCVSLGSSQPPASPE